MAKHYVSSDALDIELRQIVRSGEKIDTMYPEGDHWIVVTEDRIEIRPGVTHRERLGIGGDAA